MTPPPHTKRSHDHTEHISERSKRQRRSRWGDDEDNDGSVCEASVFVEKPSTIPKPKGDLSDIVKRLSTVVKEKSSVTPCLATVNHQPSDGAIAAAAAAARARALAQASLLAMGLQTAPVTSSDIAKRVYVGNLYYELRDDDIRSHFGPFGTIRSVDLTMEPGTNRSKGFCFIEYEDVLAAEGAVQVLNGSQLANRSLKVGRPTRGNTADAVAAQNIGREAIKDVLTKCIYVGCVRAELSSHHLQSIFSPFGDIRCSVMAPHSLLEPTSHRGYGFLEFADEQSAANAIQHMNGFELAGQKLKVGKASPSAMLINLPVSHDKVVASTTTGVDTLILNEDTHRCLCLVNMVDKGEVDDELAGEVEDECSNFGKVERVEVHELDEEVRVFVVFRDAAGAMKAKKAMNGRFFGGKQVRAGFYPLSDLVSERYDGAFR